MKLGLLFIQVLCAVNLLAQTGPAGVGTSGASATQNRIWYKADAGAFSDAGVTPVANGGTVRQWNDQSGVANHGVQATAGNRPTYLTNVVNGLPALRFSGSSWITAGAFPSIANNVGYTYIVVVRDTAFTAGGLGDGAGDYIIDRGPPGPEGNELAGLKIVSTNRFGFQKRDGGGGGLGGPTSVTSINTASFQVIDYRQTPGGTKVYDIFVDGALENTVSSADANYVPPVPQIGHHYQAGSAGLKGYIAEFILYNYNVNNAQMSILNSYLAAKYGLTLSANDRYAGDTPGNGNYDFEVAGVGQDASGANTSAASSVSGGLEVTQATAMENNEYLVYGHQAGSNILNTADVGGMSAGPSVARWDRIWYLDWTHVGGTNESVNLTFDLSDAGMTATPAAPLSNYKLLYRAGLSGNWTELANASAISGDRISFNGIVYTAGDGYYTIGTLNSTASPLPVGLLRFHAKTCAGSVCLEWTTLSEKNNCCFAVERTEDGSRFEEIETVKGAGNSHVLLNYSVFDNSPHSGLSYYRLKQIDFDGTFSYSAIEPVEFDNGESPFFDLYPNPNKGLFDLRMNVSGHVSITDARGQEIWNASLEKGNHNIDVSSALSGIYFVRLTGVDSRYGRKFVKE